jgi:hypothetical protein
MTSSYVVELPEGVNLPKDMSFVEFQEHVFDQIKKDFQLDENEAQEPFNLWLERTIVQNPHRIQASFYRLDLNEESLKNILKKEDVPMRYTLLAELSIQRAVLKVLSRVNYALKNPLNSKKN